jgi:two-component system response regulator RegX3
VKAVLKRYKTAAADEGFFTDRNFHINFSERTVSLRGEKIGLKAMEYKLLSYLVKNRNRMIPKDELFRNVWEDSFSDENTLNVHVRRLREKIEENPSEPRYIITARGKGYVFESGRSAKTELLDHATVVSQ